MTHLLTRPHTLGYVAATSAALALVLAACGGAGSEPGPSGASSGSASTSASGSDAAQEPVVVRSGSWLGRGVEVSVSGVRVVGEEAYVSVRAEVTSGEDLPWYELLSERTSGRGFGPGLPVRVLDLADDRVYDTIASSRPSGDIAQGESAQFVFPAEGLQDGDEVTVMIDSVGFFTGVPVQTGTQAPELERRQDLTEAGQESEYVSELSSMTIAWNGELDTTETEQGTQINLASDVLFDVDADALREDAATQDVIAQVAAQLGEYSSGRVRIVGHTDDVADDAYNQALSERRAASVRSALEGAADLGRFEVETTGKGESEPRVEGTTSEARQANRRVEILVDGQRANDSSDPVVAGGSQLPPAKGAEGPGPDGVAVEAGGDAITVRVPQVQRVEGYVLGEVEVSLDAGNPTAATMLSTGPRGLPGQPSMGFSVPDGLMLLEGTTWVPPVIYQMPGSENITTLVPKLGDFGASTEVGQTVTLPMVWPDPGTDTVTLSAEYFEHQARPDLRLTTIPVTNQPTKDTQ